MRVEQGATLDPNGGCGISDRESHPTVKGELGMAEDGSGEKPGGPWFHTSNSDHVPEEWRSARPDLSP